MPLEKGRSDTSSPKRKSILELEKMVSHRIKALLRGGRLFLSDKTRHFAWMGKRKMQEMTGVIN
jgi:hypothetical protein